RAVRTLEVRKLHQGQRRVGRARREAAGQRNVLRRQVGRRTPAHAQGHELTLIADGLEQRQDAVLLLLQCLKARVLVGFGGLTAERQQGRDKEEGKKGCRSGHVKSRVEVARKYEVCRRGTALRPRAGSVRTAPPPRGRGSTSRWDAP